MSVVLKRKFIIEHHEKGMRPPEIFKLGKKLKINRMMIKRTIDRYKETMSIEDRPRSGRPRTTRTQKLLKNVREKIRRNPRRSMRKMAKEAQTSPRTMRRVVENDLKMSPYKLQKRQLLSGHTIEKRVTRTRLLLNRIKEGTLPNIIFSDEKLFSVQQSHNHQNDRILSRRREESSGSAGKVFRTQKPASVMVWAAISDRGKSPLVFVPQGVKINKERYIEDILEGALLPWCNSVYGDEVWTFQQDGATSHTARVTQLWCRENCPSWISKEEWPPSSPDLNPLDFSLWSILEANACSVPCRNIDALKRKLTKCWDEISLDVVRAAVAAFPKRLRSVVKARGKHFE